MNKIISWNLNGLLSCIKHSSFESISALAPDIICCQETRTKLQHEVIPGYQHFWNPGERDGYSGTLTMTKQMPKQTIAGLGVPALDLEGRVLTTEFSDKFVVNAYAPNSQKNLIRHQIRIQWDEAFRSFLCELLGEKPVIACGDFNVTMSELDTYPENLRQYWAQLGYTSDERSNLETLLECGFVDAYRHLYPAATGSYTWWSNRLNKRDENRGWRLDYFFVSENMSGRIQNVTHLSNVMGSDHCPILLELR